MRTRIINSILNEIKRECKYIIFKSYIGENGIYICPNINFDTTTIEIILYKLSEAFDLKGFEATIHFNYSEIELYKNNKTKSFKLENKDNLFSQLLEIINKENKGSEEDEN